MLASVLVSAGVRVAGVVLVVALVVCVVVVVGVVVVGLVVTVVVGVVTSQPWNAPRTNCSTIKFIVAATASQVSAPSVRAAPKHADAAASPAGPLYSVTAAASASLVALHESSSSAPSKKFVSTSATPK